MERIDLGNTERRVIFLHRMKRPFVWEPLPFSGLPFAALLASGVPNVTPEEYSLVAGKLVSEGCRYIIAIGRDATKWDDAVDWADLERNQYEVKDENFVMTCWVDEETAEEPIENDGVFQLIHLANYGDAKFTNYLLLLLDVDSGGEQRLLDQIHQNILATDWQLD